MMWVRQVGGSGAWREEIYRCPESLPTNDGNTGNIVRDGKTWCWASRVTSGYAGAAGEEWTNSLPNGARSWYAYQGPLRVYPGAAGPLDPPTNAWDCWGGTWRGNSSLSLRDPIRRPTKPGRGRNSANFLSDDDQRVIAYCPAIEQTDGPSTWWHHWSAPHMSKPWAGDGVSLDPITDARNYLFNDGHAAFVNY